MKNETPARTDKKIAIDSSSKKFIPIVIISVLALLVLAILLFRSGQFAGKAIYTFSANPLVEVRDGNAVILIAAGDESMTGTSFNLQISGADICTMPFIDLFGGMRSGSNPGPWSCNNQVLHFDDALGWAGAAQEVKTGNVEILEIVAASGEFVFSNYEVLNGEDIFAPPLAEALRITLSGTEITTSMCSDEEERTCAPGSSLSCTTSDDYAGYQQCNANCNGYDAVCVASERCGDNIINGMETCDGTDFGTATCATQVSGSTGTLSCTSTCTLDESGCMAPVTAVCGDGNQDTGEQCDDRNTVEGDGCSSTCTLEVECTEGGTCPAVEDLFRDLTQERKIALCAQYNIEATQCGEQTMLNADINADGLIDDRDTLFIFQAIEAKQSTYNYCGAANQAPCVFGDRVICEDVSYRWTTTTTISSAPALPTIATSITLRNAGILCGNLGGSS